MADRISSSVDIETGLKALVVADPRLNNVVAQSGEVPLRLEKGGFAGLSRIIIGQQVSRASASAIYGRFVDELPELTPQAFIKAGEDAWIRIGLSRAKQVTLAGLSEAMVSGELDLDVLTSMDADDAVQMLCRYKGIGPWTAEVYLLFCAGHRDIFPAGDLALKEAVRHAFMMEDRPEEAILREIAEQWQPWRGVAARLFWAYYRVIKEGRDALPV